MAPELRAVLILILFVSFMTFVALFGQVPALRKTPISFIYRLLWVMTPRILRKADVLMTGARVASTCSRMSNYLMNEKHPTILAFFFVLLATSEFLYLPVAWPRVSPIHHLLIGVAVATPYIMLYLSVKTDPGYISPLNHEEHLCLYPYDHVLFYPGLICSTCQLPKPARSKHCRICKRCVAKNDHHCIWINNCVGYGNYHYFLLLLLTTGLLMNYAACLGYQLMNATIQAEARIIAVSQGTDIAEIASRHWSSGLSWTEYINTWSWALAQDVGLGAVSLLCFMCAPLAHGLLIYHLYLIWAGMTTNESAKWADAKEDIAEGLLWRSTRRAISSSTKSTRWSTGQPGTAKEVEPAPSTPWPNTTDQVLKWVELGHHPEQIAQTGAARAEADDHWTQVRSLEQIVNLYDVGFWVNMKDIFGQRHQRRSRYRSVDHTA